MVDVLKTLFKVNLKGAAGAGEISPEEWHIAQKAANQVEFVEGLPQDAEDEVLEREKAFLEKWPDIAQAHEETRQQNQMRTRRKAQAQGEVLMMEQDEAQEEQRRQENSFAQQLQDKERHQFEEQKRQQKEAERRDGLAMQLISQFQHIEFPMARSILESVNWDLNSAMQMISDQSSVKLTLQNALNPGNSAHTIQDRAFDLQQEGTSIIAELNKSFPQNDKVFNLYRDQGGSDPIGICVLTGKLSSLNLRSGQILYYKIETEQNF